MSGFSLPKFCLKDTPKIPVFSLLRNGLFLYNFDRFKGRVVMWIKYNPNPRGNSRAGDCVIRGITKLTDKPWEDVYTELSVYGYSFGDWGNSNAVFDAYLRDQGYKRSVIPNTCPNCYTVNQFCEDNPSGRFLVCTGRHVIGIENGDYFDSWDSGNEMPIYFYHS